MLSRNHIIPEVINLDEWVFKSRMKFRPKILWLMALFPEYNPSMAIKVIKDLESLEIDAELTLVGNPYLKDQMLKLEITNSTNSKWIPTHVGIKKCGGACTSSLLVNT